MVRALGVDLPLAANEPGEYLSPQNPRLKAPVAEMYGYDSYVKVTGSARTADFPWASSHHPLRFQQFAGGARPLTCWELGAGWWDWRAQVAPAATVQTLGAGLAHGLKGYNLYTAQDGHDPGGYTYRFGGLLDAQGRPTARLDAVARFHDFAAAHEAELTASIELQDPIVFLDYQPYTRLAPEDCLPLPISGLLEPMRYFAKWGFAGFHAVLQTAGYNVPFLDLESATDEALAGFAAAVFASRGYLDAESFLRLERFASGGGHLVTFPEPVSRHPDGSPLDGRALWPHAPVRASWCGRGRLIAHLIARWMLPYYLRTRWKTRSAATCGWCASRRAGRCCCAPAPAARRWPTAFRSAAARRPSSAPSPAAPTPPPATTGSRPRRGGRCAASPCASSSAPRRAASCPTTPSRSRPSRGSARTPRAAPGAAACSSSSIGSAPSAARSTSRRRPR
jgi:hypothetical protein